MSYKCQNFEDGQVLTAECMNKLDKAMEEAHKALPPKCDTTDCSKVLSFGANGLEWIPKPSDGSVPYIGDDGNWWIGDTDTGVSASGSGTNGVTFTPAIDTNGNLSWSNNGGLENPGTVNIKGKDGTTPYIGANGNWWIGDTDTGVSAGGSGGDSANVVLYTEQTLTPEQQAQARENIGAVRSWNDLEDKPFSSPVILYEWNRETEYDEKVEVSAGDQTITIDKISSDSPAIDFFYGKYISVDGDNERVLTSDDLYDNGGAYSIAGTIMVITADSYDIGGITLTRGIWMAKTVEIGKVQILETLAKKIDANVLPMDVFIGRKAGNNAEIFNDYANNSATGDYSHAEGHETDAIGKYSHAEGYFSTASGDCSHAEGRSTASGSNSHAEGASTVAEGGCSHAEGLSSQAKGEASHAEGESCVAEGSCSHAEGWYTHATCGSQHVQGRCNIIDSAKRYAHILGNGALNSANPNKSRSNAHTVDWDGNAWFAGDVFVGGASQDDGDKLLKKYDLTNDQTYTPEEKALVRLAIGAAYAKNRYLIFYKDETNAGAPGTPNFVEIYYSFVHDWTDEFSAQPNLGDLVISKSGQLFEVTIANAQTMRLVLLSSLGETVTDEHINALIDEKLGVIENGTY